MLGIGRRLLRIVSFASAGKVEQENGTSCPADRFEAFALSHSDLEARWYYERASWQFRD